MSSRTICSTCPSGWNSPPIPLDWVLGWRKLLEGAWSVQTIHPGFVAGNGGSPRSRGQCGVSSAWLVNHLTARYPWLQQVTYCYGDVAGAAGSVMQAQHCWVEIGGAKDPARWVLDLTSDQMEGLQDCRVIFAPHSCLTRQLEIDYRVTIKRLTPSEVPADVVHSRLAILRDSLSRRSDVA
jgi:hypothetical protein